MMTLMRSMQMSVVALAGGALVASAQQSPGGAVVADAMLKASNGRFTPAYCLPILKSSDKAGKLTSALKTAIEDKDAGKRAKALDEAKRAGLEAAQSNPKAAAPWYYLGRTALLRGEAELADSALTQAQVVAADPTCESDIVQQRQTAWVAVTNAGLDLVNGGKGADGIAYLRTANVLFRGLPQAYAALGAAYAQADKIDSSIVYFAKAAEVAAADTSLATERNRNTFNLGLMQQRAGKHADAAVSFQKYLGWVPGDVGAKKALTQAYRATGKTAEAAALEKELVATTGGTGDDAVGANDIFNIGVNLFNEKKYAEAADAFGKVLVKEPNNHEALFNQANAYLGAGNAKGLVTAAQALVTREPLNEPNYKLLIQGLRDDGQQDQLVKIAEKFLGMPVNVDVKNVTLGAKGSVSGSITGREPKDMQGKTIKPSPVDILFELLDNSGAVLTSQTVSVPALPVGQSQDFRVESGGKAFTGYRYSRK